MSREILTDKLWPEADYDIACNRLRVTLASLRRQLEPPPLEYSSVLVANRTHLWLRDGLFRTDVDEFRELTGRAETIPDERERMDAMLAALRLNQGDLLPGFYEDWIEDERRELEQRYRETASTAIDLCCEHGRAGEAFPVALRLAGMDFADEPAQRRLMRVYYALGQPGKAADIYELLRIRLRDELGAEPSAETTDLLTTRPGKSPVQPSAGRFHVIASSDSAISKPVARELPRTASSFHGREAELRRLTSLLRPTAEGGESHETGRRCLVTLIGLGGIGKTRLALQAAWENAPLFPGGAWFVPLADVEEAGQFSRSIADALRIRLLPHENTVEQVIDELRVRTITDAALIVLDNFEQLAEEGCGVVEALLAQVPKLSVIVTSRRRLGLAGEQEFRVEPLDLPKTDARREQMIETGSVALFVARAQAALPDFQLTERNAPAVSDLCRMLEGIPLAIELAGARIRLLTPAQMIAELDQRFDLLVNRRASKDSRHRSLHAAIERSVNTLPRPAREFFAMLSVFRGSWNLDAVRAISNQADALDMLDDLVGSSLIQAGSYGDEMRYSLLETIRAYAERLLPGELKDSIEARHAHYYAAWAKNSQSTSLTSERKFLCEQYELEKENIRAAFSCALRTDVSLALEIAANLRWIYFICSRLREGEEMVLRALQKVGQTRFRSVWPALVTLGALRCWMDDFSGAREPLNMALEELAPDQARERRIALSFSGWVTMHEGDFNRAFAELDEARRKYEDNNETWSAAACLNLMGYAACFAGRHTQARKLFGTGQTLSIQAGDSALAVHNLLGLGRVAWLEGIPEEAESHYRSALSDFRKHGDKRGSAYALEGLARLASSRGDHELAIRLTGAAQGLRDQLALRRDPMDQVEYDNVMEAARTAMEEARITAVLQEGLRTGDYAAEWVL